MPNPDKVDGNRRTLDEAQISKALGVFLLFFALVVLISILFTKTAIGRVTNLAAAGIIGLIGGLMVARSRKRQGSEP